MEQEQTYVDPATVGRWEGDVFVFNDPPFIVIAKDGHPASFTRIDTKGMVLAEGVTRDDVIHALINLERAEYGGARPKGPDDAA